MSLDDLAYRARVLEKWDTVVSFVRRIPDAASILGELDIPALANDVERRVGPPTTGDLRAWWRLLRVLDEQGRLDEATVLGTGAFLRELENRRQAEVPGPPEPPPWRGPRPQA